MQDLNMILQLRSSDADYQEPVNLQNLVDDIKMASDFQENERVQIHTDFSASGKLTAIKSYVYSIFLNLISNSIKYRQPDRPCIISITSHVKQDKIILVFKDNGIGIDLKKFGPEVFGLYKRFHLHIKGKGLGLFLVRTQVESLGGTISIDSKEGEGTEFRVELPV